MKVYSTPEMIEAALKSKLSEFETESNSMVKYDHSQSCLVWRNGDIFQINDITMAYEWKEVEKEYTFKEAYDLCEKSKQDMKAESGKRILKYDYDVKKVSINFDPEDGLCGFSLSSKWFRA